jgi:hypothetical protein
MATIPTHSPFGDPYRNAPGQHYNPSPGVVPHGPAAGDLHGFNSRGGPGKGTPEQQDAFASLQTILDQYGLADLDQWAWGELVNGRSASGIQIDLRNQPAFQKRFKVIFDRQKAGLAPISPSDVVNYENSWHQMTRAAGLPDSFGSRDTAQTLLGADVSLSEAQARVDQGYRQMQQAPQEVKDAFTAYFGVSGTSALAAYFTDPNLALPDLEKQVTEAQIGGTGMMQGFNVSQTMADRLARTGVTENQAQSGFGQLNQEKDLFSQSIGDTSTVSKDQGIEAQFGLSGDAATKLAQLSDQRRGAFSGRTETAADQSGLTGTGQARSV